MRVGIIDYGVGNITSVAGALEKLDVEPVISSDPKVLSATDKLILPGVGAFGDGMRLLNERGLPDPLGEIVLEDKKPILGICLGAQLIAFASPEFGETKGLGWINAEVVPISPDDSSLRVPHVGWNDYHKVADSVLHEGLEETPLFYFVHSYHVVPLDTAVVIGQCDYGGRLLAALQQDNIYAAQFHPEKSQRQGLRFLENFLKNA